MAKHNKNNKGRTQDWVRSTDSFDELPEHEKMSYVNKRRKQRRTQRGHRTRT